MPIDFVGGTSQGACMGGLFAMFDDVVELRNRATIQASSFANIWQVLSDVTIPFISYFSGFGMNNILREIYRSKERRLQRKEMQIEDTLIKFCK